MVETTSVSKENPNLSTEDRLCLIQTINALPPTQFDELVFALNPPKGVLASYTTPQGNRSKDLLDWLEGSSGPGLAAADKVLQRLIPKASKTAAQPVAFIMMGRMGDLNLSELEAVVELLRQKTGDDSISLAFSRAGSIKLILNGSPRGLAKLQKMFKAGKLEQLNIPPVEAVIPVDSNTQDARKARFIQALRFLDRDSGRAVRAREVEFTFSLLRFLGHYYIDLRGADLSGANLRNMDLTGVDLTGADLTCADVTGTIFRNNPGLTEAGKRDLQNRGAIFQDPPSSDAPSPALR